MGTASTPSCARSDRALRGLVVVLVFVDDRAPARQKAMLFAYLALLLIMVGATRGCAVIAPLGRLASVQDHPDVTAVRVALETLVDALTPSLDELAEPAHLARVRAAARARSLAAAVAEDVLDDTFVQARRMLPAGATWAELGAVLDVTPQAVSKRFGERELPRERHQSARGAQRQAPSMRVPWEHDRSAAAILRRVRRRQPGMPQEVSAEPTATPQPEALDAAAAFWRSQRTR